MLVWLSTCIPYQLNIVSDYAITQYRTNASEIAHLVRIVCSGLYLAVAEELILIDNPSVGGQLEKLLTCLVIMNTAAGADVDSGVSEEIVWTQLNQVVVTHLMTQMTVSDTSDRHVTLSDTDRS